jgi:phosphopantothenoylcysteine decarboxylase/phosphopantothenate--cysteine ligase
MKTVVIGITGGIAAFKIEEVIRALLKQDVFIEVIMTKAATSLTDTKKIEKLIGKKIYHNLFASQINLAAILKNRSVEHIDLADRADLLVIAPATANTIAKLANGIADDYLTTVALAASCPVIIFPSMNVHMWGHPITQKNIQTVRDAGYLIVDPETGLLACGYEGKGKLPKPEAIIMEIQHVLFKGDLLNGKKIIVTAGATQEQIDDIRFITNHASGKMGAAIADQLFLRSADVIFVHAVNAAMPRYAVKKIPFTSADELEKILEKEVPKVAAMFHTAAVSDFTVAKQSGKISSDKTISLKLNPRKKILSEIKKWNPYIRLIGFKAEANIGEKELVYRAEKRMREAQADYMVANFVGLPDRGFGTESNEVIIVDKSGLAIKIPLQSKREVAEKIINYVFIHE